MVACRSQQDRQQRGFGSQLAANQQPQRQDGKHHQAEDGRQRREIQMLRPLERQNERRDQPGEQHDAPDVDLPAPGGMRMRRQPQRQQRGDQAERQVDQEDRRPAQMLRQEAAGHRPERIGGDADARQIALVAGPLARRNGLTDQRLRQCHQAAAAESLQHPGGGERLDAGAQRAQERRRHEHAQSHDHQPAAAILVAQPAIDRSRHRRGDQVGHHDPRCPLGFAGRCDDRRQRGRHDGLVDGRQKHRQHDGRKNAQEGELVRSAHGG